MTSLADLDRPIESHPYEPWQQDIKIRAMSAEQFVQTQDMISKVSDDKTGMVAAWSKVCSWCITDPQFTPEEWSSQATLSTLIELGNLALAKSSKSHLDAAKKNLTTTAGSSSSSDSVSSCT